MFRAKVICYQYILAVCAFHWTFWDFFSEVFLFVKTKTSVRHTVLSSALMGRVLLGVGILAEPGGQILAGFWKR